MTDGISTVTSVTMVGNADYNKLKMWLSDISISVVAWCLISTGPQIRIVKSVFLISLSHACARAPNFLDFVALLPFLLVSVLKFRGLQYGRWDVFSVTLLPLLPLSAISFRGCHKDSKHKGGTLKYRICVCPFIMALLYWLVV